MENKQERLKIFNILVFEKLEPRKDGLGADMGSERVWGFYHRFDWAEGAVINNVTDINETCYNYALIEEVEEGIATCAKNRWFYKFNKTTKKYEKIEEPECFKRVFGFTMGWQKLYKLKKITNTRFSTPSEWEASLYSSKNTLYISYRDGKFKVDEAGKGEDRKTVFEGPADCIFNGYMDTEKLLKRLPKNLFDTSSCKTDEDEKAEELKRLEEEKKNEEDVEEWL